MSPLNHFSTARMATPNQWIQQTETRPPLNPNPITFLQTKANMSFLDAT